MRAIYFTLCSGCFLLISACGTQLTNNEKIALEKVANTPITCNSEEDCDRKWARAVHWVTQYSVYKVHMVSDNMIQTSGPRRSSTKSAFTVTKYAIGDKLYTIDFNSACNNWFACTPSSMELKASFNHFVLSDN